MKKKNKPLEEVKETKPEEKKIEVPPQPQVPEVVVASGYSKISKESYLEFFKIQSGFLQQLKQSSFIIILMCIYFYIFRGDNPFLTVLTQCVICIISILLVTFIFNIVTRFLVAPKNYDRNKINEIEIKYDFSNLGVRQTIADEKGDSHTGLIYWTEITKAYESETAFYFIATRNGLITEKVRFNAGDIDAIRKVVLENLSTTRFKDLRKLNKKGEY